MTIKRNKDGRHNLAALRKAVADNPNVDVRSQSGGWIIQTLVNDCWHETPAPYYCCERKALQQALGIDVAFEQYQYEIMSHNL
jgi:hypothetical protein